MICEHWAVLLLLGLAVIFSVVIPYHLVYMKYCDRLSKLEGNEKERYSLRGFEGGGMNFYEIENAGKIRTRNFLKYGDQELTDLGNRLIRNGNICRIVILSVGLSALLLKTIVCASP